MTAAPAPDPLDESDPTGLLIVHTRHRFGGWGRPVITVDGRPAASRRGENPYRLPPGSHDVAVAMPLPANLATINRAELTVDVRPDQTTDVFYAQPFVPYIPGAIATVPVRTPAAVFTVVLLGVTVAIVAIMLWVLAVTWL